MKISSMLGFSSSVFVTTGHRVQCIEDCSGAEGYGLVYWNIYGKPENLRDFSYELWECAVSIFPTKPIHVVLYSLLQSHKMITQWMFANFQGT